MVVQVAYFLHTTFHQMQTSFAAPPYRH
uniref:Uncharacterized protein n=1 Tax=Arundo donax TaxID=35708 RepID=A0A0A9GBC0_ARUDO